MTTPLLLGALGVLFSLTTAKASLITVDAMAGLGQKNLVNLAGDPVPDGNEVQIGYFDVNPATLTTIPDVRDNFNLFGTPITVAPIMGTSNGLFTGSPSAQHNDFTGKQIYMLAFLTGASGAPDPDWDNVAELGIFTGDLSIWTFPDPNVLPSAMVTSDDVTVAINGTINPTVGMQLGSLQLGAGVPEPSPFLISGLFIAAGFLLNRRRPRGNAPNLPNAEANQ